VVAKVSQKVHVKAIPCHLHEIVKYEAGTLTILIYLEPQHDSIGLINIQMFTYQKELPIP